jgi:ribonuclease E
VTEELVDDFAGVVILEEDKPSPPASLQPETRKPERQESVAARAVEQPPTAELDAVESAESRSRRRAADPSSSEPKIERVVVTPDQGPAPAEGETAQPVRRGWWQRRLGG